MAKKNTIPTMNTTVGQGILEQIHAEQEIIITEELLKIPVPEVPEISQVTLDLPPRPLKELVQLLSDKLESQGMIIEGLCYLVFIMRWANWTSDDKFIINKEEEKILHKFVMTAKPWPWQVRYWCTNGVWSRPTKRAFFWTSGQYQPRVDWLKKQLTKL
jgi:hypothetical protein